MNRGSAPASDEAVIAGVPSLAIHLLGSPAILRNGEPAAHPRGNKVWAILAFLALTGGPQPRQLLAEMLFPKADDPLGTLRWNISELRRLLGGEIVVGGDPVTLRPSSAVLFDTEVLLNGTWMEAVRLPGLGRDLLEGLYFDSAPGFELWLTYERARLGASAEAILREATLASLARRDHATALGYATRLVSLNAYDENAHVLLARVLVASGDRMEALRHVERTMRMFREEMGVTPSPSFRLAALSDTATSIPHPSRAAVEAQMEAGEAAIAAGSWLTGIEALRGAAVASEAIGEDLLVARAHLSLGSSLVHAARGFDEEGAKYLHQAIDSAERAGDGTLAARSKRELAYVELLRGRYDRALAWLDQAGPLVGDNDPESAWIASVRGACETDTANYTTARHWLEVAVDRAEATADTSAGAFAHNLLGRLHLLRRELVPAQRHLGRSLELARSASWTAFVPFPMSLLAEVTLLTGELEAADQAFDHAFALSTQIGDPCWESLGARGLGLVAAAREDPVSAMARLDEAPRVCRRFPDSYLWVEAYALEALCRVAVKAGAPGALAMIAELETIAARTGMQEMLARAMLHRAALGQPQALKVAESLITMIDNPALEATLEAARA